MLRTALRIGAVVVVLSLAAQQADAFGHRCRGWGGGCGYGGCYAGYGYGGYGYGGWGYGGWGYGGWGYGAVRSPAGYLADSASPATAVATSTVDNSAMLTVSVPADAKVFVNGHATTSTGANRNYISRDLKPGATYTYHVRAEFTREGQPVSEEQTVQLGVGQTRALAFDGGQQAPIASTARR